MPETSAIVETPATNEGSVARDDNLGDLTTSQSMALARYKVSPLC